MTTLPFVDEHSQAVRGSRDALWLQLITMIRNELGGHRRIARALGCDPVDGTAAFDGKVGDAVPGFRVVESTPARRLALYGRHRFAEYMLTFELDGDRIRAVTHAGFPGVRGKLYRAAVIGTGGHRFVVRRMLKRLADHRVQ